MSNVRFIYSGDKYDYQREVVVAKIITLASSLVNLPDTVEVEFVKLDKSVYGEMIVDPRFKNRIRIQENLSIKEVIIPVIHELLHVCQIHNGMLSGRRDGSFLWRGKVYRVPKNPTPKEWKNLPWEIDVAEKQQKLLETVLKLGISES